MDCYQRRYVEHAIVPRLVLLGAPGAGKTKCIVSRLTRIIGDGFLAAGECILLSFTRSAAEELNNRINIQGLRVLTIDALAYRILKQNSAQRVSDVQSLCIQLYRHLRGLSESQQRGLALFLGAAPKLIIVDEAQDLNFIQYEIFLLLQQIFSCALEFVGDPRQSIFGFRGSSSELMLHLENSEILHLQNNYRSTKGICNLLNAVYSDMAPVIAAGEHAAILTKPTLFANTTSYLLQGVAAYAKNNLGKKTIAVIAPCLRSHKRGVLGLSPVYTYCVLAGIRCKMYGKNFLDVEEKDETKVLHFHTIHSSKGREFDTVFFVEPRQMLQRRFVSKKSHEEYKKYIYVGISRAKQDLFLLLSQELDGPVRGDGISLHLCSSATGPHAHPRQQIQVKMHDDIKLVRPFTPSDNSFVYLHGKVPSFESNVGKIMNAVSDVCLRIDDNLVIKNVAVQRLAEKNNEQLGEQLATHLKSAPSYVDEAIKVSFQTLLTGTRVQKIDRLRHILKLLATISPSSSVIPSCTQKRLALIFKDLVDVDKVRGSLQKYDFFIANFDALHTTKKPLAAIVEAVVFITFLTKTFGEEAIQYSTFAKMLKKTMTIAPTVAKLILPLVRYLGTQCDMVRSDNGPESTMFQLSKIPCLSPAIACEKQSNVPVILNLSLDRGIHARDISMRKKAQLALLNYLTSKQKCIFLDVLFGSVTKFECEIKQSQSAKILSKIMASVAPHKFCSQHIGVLQHGESVQFCLFHKLSYAVLGDGIVARGDIAEGFRKAMKSVHVSSATFYFLRNFRQTLKLLAGEIRHFDKISPNFVVNLENLLMDKDENTFQTFIQATKRQI